MALLGGNLTLTASSAYTGATTVSGGTLTLSGNGALTASPITVNQGGTLLLDTPNTNNNARMNVATTLNGGTLQIKGNSGGTTESIGAITLGAGNSTITLTPQGGNVLSCQARPSTGPSVRGSTLNFNASNLGTTTKVTFSTTPGTAGAVLPFVTVNGSDYGTYVAAAASIESYTASGGSYVNLSGATSAQNVNLPGTGSLDGVHESDDQLAAGDGQQHADYQPRRDPDRHQRGRL